MPTYGALTLNKHRNIGQLTYEQVDSNWDALEGTVNKIGWDLSFQFPNDNLTATTDPTVNDDSGAGYSEFSRWYNSTNQTLWALTDPTPGAAVWVDTGWEYLQLGSASIAQIGTGPTEVPQNADLGTAAYLNFGTGDDDLLKKSAGDALYMAITVTLGDLGAGNAVTFDEATLSEFILGTADKILTAEVVKSAHARYVLTDAATIAIDCNNGLNYEVTLASAASRVLGNPTNEIVGAYYSVLVKGTDSSASTLTFDTEYGGEIPTLDDLTDTKWYSLTIQVISGTHFIVSAQDASPP